MYGHLSFLRFNDLDPQEFGTVGGNPVSSYGGNEGHGYGHTTTFTVTGNYVASPHFVVDGNFGLTRMVSNSAQLGITSPTASSVGPRKRTAWLYKSRKASSACRVVAAGFQQLNGPGNSLVERSALRKLPGKDPQVWSAQQLRCVNPFLDVLENLRAFGGINLYGAGSRRHARKTNPVLMRHMPKRSKVFWFSRLEPVARHVNAVDTEFRSFLDEVLHRHPAAGKSLAVGIRAAAGE